jgi:multiple sugar transport system substrate-binding protein
MRRIVAALLLLCLLCPLCGCHGSEGMAPFQMPEEFDSSRQYEITFWAKNDNNNTQVEIYRKAITDFQALYPNITVNLRLYVNYGDIYNDVITNIATDTTPNVCITYPDHIATYLSGDNTVVPLDELFANERYGLGGSQLRFDGPTQAEITPKFLEECRLGGKYYAIPYMRSTEACYVNRDFVEALGFTLPETLTWDFIWEVSEAAMAKDAEGNYLLNGQKVLIPCIYKSTDNMMIQMLEQKGAGYSTDEGDILLFNDTTTQILETVAQHAKTRAFSTFKIDSYPANFLNAGQCIFAIDSTAGATWMGSDAPLIDIAEEKLVDFELEVMTVPQFDTENPKMISQGPSVCVFNKEDPQQVLASWLFAQYLLTNDVQIAYSQTEGYAPVTSKAQNSAVYQDYLARAGEDNDLYYDVKIQATRLLLENTNNTFTTPVFNGSASLRNAAGQLIESVVKTVRRGKTVDINQIYSETASLYRLNQGGRNLTAGKAELEPLPGASVMLLAGLGGVWLLMGAGWVIGTVKREKQKNR